MSRGQDERREAREAKLRAYLEGGCTVAFEHVLVEAGIPPDEAHRLAETMASAVSHVAEQSARGVDVARDAVAGAAQRACRDMLRRTQGSADELRALTPPEIRAAYQPELTRQLEQLRLGQPQVRVHGLEWQKPQNQVAVNEHKLTGRELAKGMQKDGRPGKIIQNPGRQQRRDHERGRGH
jgi:hypothetical protein